MNSNQVEKATIDDASLAMLLDEVSAMTRHGRSLVAGLVDLDRSGMGKIGRAARQTRQRIEQGHPAAEAIAELSTTHATPIRVAMQIMAQTGTTESIDELVHLIEDADEHRRQMRLAAIYPMLNIVIAAVVLFFVMPFVMTSVSEADLVGDAFSPTVTKVSETFQTRLLLATAATVILVGIFGVILYWGIRRSIQSMDIQRDHAVFCRWLAIQVRASVDTSQSIEAASAVVDSRFADSWKVVADRVRSGSQTGASLGMPMGTPELVQTCMVDLVAGKRNQASLADDLVQLSAMYEQQSQQRRSWWIDVLPNWVTSFLMITVMAILLRVMLLPLWRIVEDVAG